MTKRFKFAIAILLLPLCAGAVAALAKLLRTTVGVETFWVTFLGGMACWLAIYLLLPKPMWVYVCGHELTHALWTWLFGGKVKTLRVTAKGGHVVISKSNFLIVLAPYFFPFYVAVLVAFFTLGHLFFGWKRFMPLFHFLVGAAYSFHVSLTWYILRTRQSDITSQGYLFSGVIIFLGNVSVLLLGLPLLTSKASIVTALNWWLQDSVNVIVRLTQLI